MIDNWKGGGGYRFEVMEGGGGGGGRLPPWSEIGWRERAWRVLGWTVAAAVMVGAVALITYCAPPGSLK